MENILVTGAAGFIGYNLTKNLIVNKNTQITGVDSLNNAYDKDLKKLRLKNLELNDNFTFRNINLSNQESLKKLKVQILIVSYISQQELV